MILGLPKPSYGNTSDTWMTLHPKTQPQMQTIMWHGQTTKPHKSQVTLDNSRRLHTYIYIYIRVYICRYAYLCVHTRIHGSLSQFWSLVGTPQLGAVFYRGPIQEPYMCPSYNCNMILLIQGNRNRSAPATGP